VSSCEQLSGGPSVDNGSLDLAGAFLTLLIFLLKP
jgi:hypothetical protein